MTSDRFKWLEFGDATPPPEGPHADGGAVGRNQFDHLKSAEELFREADYEPALRHYSAALKYDPAMAEAWAGQVRCMVRMGELEQALTWAQKGLHMVPESPLTLSAMALALGCSGNTVQALRASDAALALCKGGSVDGRVWLERGVALLRAGQRETAAGCLEKTREASPDDAEWAQQIGIEYLAAGDATLALREFNRAAAARPERAALWLLTATAAARLNLVPQAREALQKARALKPLDKEIGRIEKLLQGRDRPCWIATLVFERPDHPVVEALRQWRDRQWMSRPTGRLAAAIYDRTAPRLCAWLQPHPRLRRALRLPLSWLACHVTPFPRPHDSHPTPRGPQDR